MDREGNIGQRIWLLASIFPVAITISIIDPLLNMSPMYRVLQLLKCHDNITGMVFCCHDKVARTMMS